MGRLLGALWGGTPMERRSVCGMFIGSTLGAAPLWRGGLSVGCLLGAPWGLHPYGEEVCLWDVYWERSGGCTLMDRQGRRRGGQLPGSLHNGLGPP